MEERNGNLLLSREGVGSWGKLPCLLIELIWIWISFQKNIMVDGGEKKGYENTVFFPLFSGGKWHLAGGLTYWYPASEKRNPSLMCICKPQYYLSLKRYIWKPFNLASEESQYYLQGRRRAHILAEWDSQSFPCWCFPQIAPKLQTECTT